MPVKRLIQEDYLVSRWSGGTTTQIAIFPRDAAYGDRDFLWRVSSAVVEDEESDFTPLPDYRRWLLLLEGSLLLAHDGEAPLRLDPYEPHAFDGGAATRSLGRCRDFNLMLRKGKCRGQLRPLRFSQGGEAEIRCQIPPDGSLARSALLLYCGSGEGAALLGGTSFPISQGESLLLEEAAPFRLAVPAEADFVAAEVWY